MKRLILIAGITLLWGLTFGSALTNPVRMTADGLPTGQTLPVASSQNVKCPIDGSGAYFTGKTKTAENGKLLKLYKCLQFGHEFWIVPD